MHVALLAPPTATTLIPSNLKIREVLLALFLRLIAKLYQLQVADMAKAGGISGLLKSKAKVCVCCVP